MSMAVYLFAYLFLIFFRHNSYNVASSLASCFVLFCFFRHNLFNVAMSMAVYLFVYLLLIFLDITYIMSLIV